VGCTTIATPPTHPACKCDRVVIVGVENAGRPFGDHPHLADCDDFVVTGNLIERVPKGVFVAGAQVIVDWNVLTTVDVALPVVLLWPNIEEE
jgi:hypothetical protein